MSKDGFDFRRNDEELNTETCQEYFLTKYVIKKIEHHECTWHSRDGELKELSQLATSKKFTVRDTAP